MKTTSRTCRWVRRRLPLLVGGELAVAERRRVERHLIGCPACRGRRDASKQSLSVLRDVAALGPIAPGFRAGGDRPSVWPALARQIRESRHRPDRLFRWDWARSWSLRAVQAQPVLGFALIAAALVVALGWMGWSGRSGPVEAAHPATGLGAEIPIATAPISPSPRSNPADPTLAGHDSIYATLDDFEAPIARPERRASALPDGETSRGLAIVKPGSNPFQPPLSLRLDYDLDWGTLSAPAQQDTQRAY